MNTSNEFDSIGKRTTYKVPDGFFEQFSEKTLRIAKQREQKRKNILTLWRTIGIAASMTAVALLAGYWMSEPNIPVTSPIVQNTKSEIRPSTDQTELIRQPQTIPEMKQPAQQKIVTSGNDQEGISAVLSDMSDDELLLLAAMYKNDPFLEESPQ